VTFAGQGGGGDERLGCQPYDGRRHAGQLHPVVRGDDGGGRRRRADPDVVEIDQLDGGWQCGPDPLPHLDEREARAEDHVEDLLLADEAQRELRRRRDAAAPGLAGQGQAGSLEQ
jgi:hypothetical protein